MPVPTSYPGVYVEELPNGSRTIAGVNSSVALFVGRAKWGPANFPVLCLSYNDFLRTFTDDSSQGDMARAVRLFFLNGGTQCYVTRIAAKAVSAMVTLQDAAGTDSLTITAKYPGELGNSIRAIVSNASGATFDLELYRDIDGVKTDSQSWTGLSMGPLPSPINGRPVLSDVNYSWAVLSQVAANTKAPVDTAVAASLAMGSDGTVPTPGQYKALYYDIIDKAVDLFNVMILPRDVSASLLQINLWGEASIFCKKRRAFLLMDPPYPAGATLGWTDAATASNSSTGVSSLRRGLAKDHCAVFFPNLVVTENGSAVQVGPSGAIAGLMARTDANRGVWKAAAGTGADIRGISGVEYRLSDADSGVLNPRGVNTIRIFRNGIVNWGARTMDGDDSFASEYKYIPVRRTALFIEESIYRGLQWVVFEPNAEPLWAQVRLNVGAFMHNLFLQGAFQGTKKEDAYFVKCDAETTTQNDINLGFVHILVGFAPLKPAEFVVLHFQQRTGQMQV